MADETDDLFGLEPDIDDAAEAFMKAQAAVDKEVSKDDQDAPEDGPEDKETEDTEGDLEESEDDPDGVDGSQETKGTELDATAEYEVKVGDKTKKFTFEDISRIVSQEEAVTQRAASVAERTRAVEAQGAYLAKVLDARYKAAQDNLAKYDSVDLFKASRDLEPEEFDALQSSIKAAKAEFATIDEEARTFMKNVTETRATLIREQAKESLKTITKEIPEWNDALYGELRTYAVSQGMDRDQVNEVVDAGTIIMMHKAMKYDKAQQNTEKVKKLVTKTAVKTLRKSSNPADANAGKLKAARAAAATTGSIDDVADLFYATEKLNNN